jgi:hypothetical protein
MPTQTEHHTDYDESRAAKGAMKFLTWTSFLAALVVIVLLALIVMRQS